MSIPAVNLVLTVRTMVHQTETKFFDGNVAIAAARRANEDPFVTSVVLVNLVPDGVRHVPPALVPNGNAWLQVPGHEEPQYQEVLVWENVQTMPRWVTHAYSLKAYHDGMNAALDEEDRVDG